MKLVRLLAIGTLLLGLIAMPVVSQARSEAACKPTTQGRRGASLLGSLGGGLIERGLENIGVPTDYRFKSTLNAMLTDSFACMLDRDERKRAADATTRAVGGTVGTKADWTSETRPGVSGSSTVVGETRSADGTICRSVNDVAIVNGEETTVSKKLCKAPGAAGFTMAA